MMSSPPNNFRLFSDFAPPPITLIHSHQPQPSPRHAAELSGDVSPLLVFQIAPET